MYKPIIHNLTKDDEGFNEVQHYNYLLDNKQTLYFTPWMTLREKIDAEHLWKRECNVALSKVREILKGETK